MSACLYCKRENQRFSSVEHILPESLGNNGSSGQPELVLPKGVVCDLCNHGKLSDLDNALIDFSPIAFMKTFHGVPSKGGKLPKAKFGNAIMEMKTPGHVQFDSVSKRSFQPLPEGFQVKTIGNRQLTPLYKRKLARALFRITLGLIYYDHGPEKAFSERFDPVRRMILGSEDFHGYLMLLKKVKNPSGYVRVAYDFWEGNAGERTVWVWLECFGVTLFTDLEIRTPRHPELIPSDSVELLTF